MWLVPVAWRNLPKMQGLGARAFTRHLRQVPSHATTQCSSCFMRLASSYPLLRFIHEQLTVRSVAMSNPTFNPDSAKARVGCNKRSALHRMAIHAAQCPLVIAPYMLNQSHPAGFTFPRTAVPCQTAE